MDNNEIWAAGVVSVMGSFTAATVMRKLEWGYGLYPKFTLGSRPHALVIERMCDIAGVEVKRATNKQTVTPQLVLVSEELHEFMKRLWPELSTHRKMQYKLVRERCAASKLTEEDILRLTRARTDRLKEKQRAEIQAEKLRVDQKNSLDIRRAMRRETFRG